MMALAPLDLHLTTEQWLRKVPERERAQICRIATLQGG